MTLLQGARLGSYEVVAPLGAGGMGEVYRARDTRLGREVAIKVLPADRMADEGRRRRFVQEARAASALNHPNIVTIYEIESAEGVDFLVMEYVPGPTLDGLIPKHGMNLGEVLRVAMPLADGLAAAHSRGIVHRDLKPANVIVTREGVVKVLDFGLAKLVKDETEDTGETLTTASGSRALSRPGAVTGTAGYMSPEQATGGKADARSDVFSFGAVLYEMVTGRRAFAGKTASETLTAVVRDQPKAPKELVPGIPDTLERLILRCLRKEPERRFQHMTDVRVELQELKEDSDSAAMAPAAPSARTRRAWGMAGLATFLIVSAAAAWLWRSHATALPPARVVSLTALLGYSGGATFSPDGERLAFYWNGEAGDNYDIYVKLVGASELQRLTTDPAADWRPAWSPDGRRIAFVRTSSPNPSGAGALHLISALGGPVRRLNDLPVSTEATMSWSSDGHWIAAARTGSRAETTPDAHGIYLVPVEGGEPRPLTRAQPAGADQAPALSPDGRRLAYAACVSRSFGACDVHVVELGPDLVPTGSPRRLTRQNVAVPHIAWMPDGRSVVYDTLAGPGVFHLWRVAIDGSRPPERVEVAGIGAEPAISRNRLALTRVRADQDLMRLTPGRPPEVFPASSSFWDGQPQFSPDGRRIAFESMRSGERMEIWLAAADGRDPVQLTRGPGRWRGSPAWSPDGHRIAFDSQGEDGHWDIWTIDVTSGGPRRLTEDPGDENVPSWSRDGHWVYYSAAREGKGGIWRIPAAGGVEARVAGLDASWARTRESLDGKTLFFAGGPQASPLFALPLAGGPAKKLVDRVCASAFEVAEGGVYYGACGRGPDTQLHRLDFATGKDSVVGTLAKFRYAIAVSPDGKTILYTSETRSGSDLMLVEGFR